MEEVVRGIDLSLMDVTLWGHFSSFCFIDVCLFIYVFILLMRFLDVYSVIFIAHFTMTTGKTLILFDQEFNW